MNNGHIAELQGKTILITGAGSGFGAACAHAAYAAGAQLILIDTAETGLSVTSSDFEMTRVMNIAARVTDLEEMKKAVQIGIDQFGGIDVVFANIGVYTDSPSTCRLPSLGRFHGIIDFNLSGIWNTVRASLPSVKASCGHIQITSSSYGCETGLSNAPHKIPHFAVDLFSRELRKELDGTGATAEIMLADHGTDQRLSSGKISNRQIAAELLRLSYRGVIASPMSSVPSIRSVLTEM